MDIAIIVILLILVAILFKRFSSVIYLIAIIDIFLRILNFIAGHLPIEAIKSFILKYFPSSIASIISKYSSGILEEILLWALLVIYIIFLYYIIRVFFKKR